MAEELNMHFSSVFTLEDTSSLPVPETRFKGSEGERLGQLVVTPEVVASKINNMKENKSPGVDFVFIHFSHIVKPRGSTTTHRRCRAYSLINGVGDPTCRAYRRFHSRKQQSRPSFLNGKLCHTSTNIFPELLSLL